MRKTINITAIILICIGLYNLFSLKGFLPAIRHVNTELCLLYFDIALALTTGLVIYILTSALPLYISQYHRRKKYKSDLKIFIVKSIEKLKSIHGIDYTQPKKIVKFQFSEMKYGKRVKKNSENKIYDVLNTLCEQSEDLNNICTPLILKSEDYKIYNQVSNKIIKNRLFSAKRIYRYTEIPELEGLDVKIGGYIKDFYDELVKLESSLT